VMTRADHPSGTDRVAEAVQGLGGGVGVVVNIQGDEPLIDPGLIDRLAETLQEDRQWDMATAAARMEDEADRGNPSLVKVVFDRDRRALYFSRALIPFVRDGRAAPGGRLYWRHIGIYAYRARFLKRMVAEPPCALERAEKLEQLRALYLGARMAVVETESCGVGVDTPEDVRTVGAILRRMERRGHGTTGKGVKA